MKSKIRYFITIIAIFIIPCTLLSQGWNVDLVSSHYNLWDNAKSLVVSDHYAYVATVETGLRIVDIAEPTDPVEVGYCNTLGEAYNVAVSGDVAYVGNWQNDTLYVIDVSEPETPFVANTIVLPRFPCNLHTAGSYLYITVGSEGLLIFDISNPSQPALINTYTTNVNANDISVVGNYAYLTTLSGLHVLDISDPLNIFQVGIDSSITSTGQILISGEYAFIAGSRLTIADISNPANPYVTGTCNTNVQNRGMDISGTIVYIAFDDAMVGGPINGGLLVIDVSDPYNPIESNIYSIPSISTDVTILDNTAYVTNCSSGLHVIDISTPTNPVEIGRFGSLPSIKNIAIIPNYVFTAHGSDVRILDVSDPTNPLEIGVHSIISSYSTNEPITGIAISDHNLYVGYSNYCTFGGILTIDISDPNNLQEIGRYETEYFSIQELYIFDNLGYARTWGAVTIMDMSDPSALEVISMCSPCDEMIRNIAVSTDHNYVYVAALTKIPIVDVSDPANPFVASVYDPNGGTYGIAYSYHYIYYTLKYYDTTNFIILDVSNPIDPLEVGSCEIPNPAAKIEVVGNYAFLADGSAGVRVIDVSDRTNPIETGFYNTPGIASGLKICDSYAYVNDRYFFEILDVSQAIPNPMPPKIPYIFTLHPAYPNPFNPSTTLSFSMQVGANVSLKVYDVTGRYIATLVDSWRDRGIHKISFDGSGLASGIYLYYIKVGEFTTAEKMILLK